MVFKRIHVVGLGFCDEFPMCKERETPRIWTPPCELCLGVENRHISQGGDEFVKWKKKEKKLLFFFAFGIHVKIVPRVD